MVALMRHQTDGVDWLDDKPAAILASDPGLGKTAMAITSARRKGARRITILCPASLRAHWAREMGRFWPKHPALQVVTHGRQVIDPATPVTICNYDLLLHPAIYRQLTMARTEMLVCDESHLVNNPESGRGQAVLGNHGLARYTQRVLALSGSPAPNHVGELHAWLSVICPDLLKGARGWPDVTRYEHFLNHFCRYKTTKYGISVLGARNSAEFKARFAPVILRQRKSLLNLPPLRIGEVVIAPSQSLLRQLKKHPDYEQISAIVRELGADPDGDHAALRAILDTTHLATLRRLTALAKIAPTADLVMDELAGGRGKIVLFAHHRELIDGLADQLSVYRPAVIHGGVPPDQRQPEVDRFQEDARCRVFVGQIDTAGLGYTLTAATDVLMVEASWVPSKNRQCIDRIYRIGQTENCLARFVGLAGSVDEIVMRVQARKAEALSELML